MALNIERVQLGNQAALLYTDVNVRPAALLLAVLLALSASPARAQETPRVVKTQRGFLSGLGLGLLIGGLAGVGAGIGGLVSANEAQTTLAAYGGTVNDAQRPTVTALYERLRASTTLAGVGLIGGGLALAGGILCLAIDTPSASVAFVPSTQGGALVFTARF